MLRLLALIYGVCCCLVFGATAACFVGFLTNTWVPWSVAAGREAPAGEAILLNLLLLGLFGLQHSGMARERFKRWWTQAIHPAVERSTYVLLSSLALVLLFWQWRPIPLEVWRVDRSPFTELIHLVALLGAAVMVAASVLIDARELLGLRQVWSCCRARPYTSPGFRTPGLYRHVRHPLMLGALVILWATPHMTAGHLLFSSGMSLYIFIGIGLEERDLLRRFGLGYEVYRRRVPMLWPRLRRWEGGQS